MSTTETLIQKLQKMKDYLEQTNDKRCADALNDTLEDLFSCDTFGTEGQNDPRGDQREAKWVPYDEDDEDSEGEYEYIQVGDWYQAPEVVQNLINTVNLENDDDYSNGIMEAFNEIFERFGF